VRVLAVDFGERRIGLALSDPTRTIAQPLPTLVRRAGKRIPFGKILEIISQNDVAQLVLGLPLTMSGDDSDWTRTVREFGEQRLEKESARTKRTD
jgi:putative Holliday junction resolvase